MLASWLTWALGRQDGDERTVVEPPVLPRIPVRRVDEGGFEELMRRPGGRGLAEAWWDEALEMTPVAAPGDPAEGRWRRLFRRRAV